MWWLRNWTRRRRRSYCKWSYHGWGYERRLDYDWLSGIDYGRWSYDYRWWRSYIWSSPSQRASDYATRESSKSESARMVAAVPVMAAGWRSRPKARPTMWPSLRSESQR